MFLNKHAMSNSAEEQFHLFIDGHHSYYNSSTRSNERLPASNDSWSLKLKPSVSFEIVSSNYLELSFERIKHWSSDVKKDAFSRLLYLCMSRFGPSPNVFFPDLGVFAQEIAMQQIVSDAPGHYAYGSEP